VSESREPLAHLLRGIEELCRGAADSLALARDRLEHTGPERAGVERAVASLADRMSEWLASAATLDELRASLRAEVVRWELRAGEDAAARRVYELFAALLELLEPDAATAPEVGAPRRAGSRGFRGRPREPR
jgi:hypothetical protein